MRTSARLAAAAAFACGSALAADAVAPAPTDLSLEIVRLDPPSGSTLKAGEPITAIIAWRYSTPAKHIPVWMKPDVPDDVHSTYVADGGEALPGTGRLERYVSLDEPGHLGSLSLVAKDANSHEIYRRHVQVDYTFVENPAQAALRRDGKGSRITSVSFEPASPARLAPGMRVAVRIGYDAHSEHGIAPSVEPVTRCPMTYRGYDFVEGRGTKAQWFAVGEPCVVRQVRVQLLNAGKVAVDERLVDVDFRYER